MSFGKIIEQPFNLVIPVIFIAILIVALSYFALWMRRGFRGVDQNTKQMLVQHLESMSEILEPMTRERFESEMIARNGFVEHWMYEDALPKHKNWQYAQLDRLLLMVSHLEKYRTLLTQEETIRVLGFKIQIAKMRIEKGA